jgi:leucyl/phenylalanyl-tRNA--protein transferase
VPVFRLTKKLLFPPVRLANRYGLLAVGGDLTPERLLLAYANGIFPWYSDGEPILWWSPNPRMVLFPDKLHVSKSLRRTLNSKKYRVTMDNAFDQVIASCASVRRQNEKGTWITEDMQVAYNRLHQLGWAHSIESWYNDRLVGGLYGVGLGRCFFGESMFSLMTDASKAALVFLVEHARKHQMELIDCQVPSDHLLNMGAQTIPRELFLSYLKT